MTKLRKVSNEELEDIIKSDKTLGLIYMGLTITCLIVGLFTMNTLIWISFFGFLIMTIAILFSGEIQTIRLENRKNTEDIKNMIKILEEGDNYERD